MELSEWHSVAQMVSLESGRPKHHKNFTRDEYADLVVAPDVRNQRKLLVVGWWRGGSVCGGGGEVTFIKSESNSKSAHFGV